MVNHHREVCVTQSELYICFFRQLSSCVLSSVVWVVFADRLCVFALFIGDFLEFFYQICIVVLLCWIDLLHRSL